MAPPVQRIEDSFVFCDVLRCSGDGCAVTELDEPRRLEHEERAAAVGRIVRDSYTGAVRKIFQVFNLLEKTDIGSRWIAPAETSFRFLDRTNSSRYGLCWK